MERIKNMKEEIERIKGMIKQENENWQNKCKKEMIINRTKEKQEKRDMLIDLKNKRKELMKKKTNFQLK